MLQRFLAILFLFVASSALAQTPGTTSYPSGLDTTLTLMDARNNAQSTLNGTINAGATTLTLTDASSFSSIGGALSVENEIIYYTGKSGNNLTGLLRGAEGTTAASHLSGRIVRMAITRGYHNVVRDALIELQKKVGVGAAPASSAASGSVLTADGAGGTFWQALSGGGDALTGSPLNQFAETTSAQLADTISNETGSGALVFGTSPTFTTQITAPKLVWTGSVQDLTGSGSPEGVVTAAPGSVYRNRDGGSSVTLYVKESLTGNTGWVAVGAGGGSGTVSGQAADTIPLATGSTTITSQSALTQTGTGSSSTITAAGNLVGAIPQAAFGSFPTCNAANVRRSYKATDVNRDVYDCVLSGSTYQWRSRNGGVYRPKDFGVVGSGLVDDATALQALFDAVPNGAVIEVDDPAANYFINTSLTMTGKQGVKFLHHGKPISGYPRITYSGADGQYALNLLDCYNVTIAGFAWYIDSGVAPAGFVKIDRSAGFSSFNWITDNIFIGTGNVSDSFRVISISETEPENNNENMHIENNTISCTGALRADIRGTDQGAMTSGSATLTCSDCNFQPGDVGKVIRVGKAGTAGATLVSTIATRNSTTEVVLQPADTAQANVSNARVHIGRAWGTGIYNGNNPNAKHQIIKNNQITYCNIGIENVNGSMQIENLGGGYSHHGVKITTFTETFTIKDQNQEGNLVEVETGLSNHRLVMVNGRGSNSYQLSEYNFKLTGDVTWENSGVENAPPIGGAVVKATGSLNLDLTGQKWGVAQGRTLSLTETGFTAFTEGQRVNIRGGNLPQMPPNGILNPVSDATSSFGLATSGFHFLSTIGTVTNNNYIGSSTNLHAVARNSLVIGDGELELSGIQRPNPVHVTVRGTTGSTSYAFSLVACDANDNCSLRSVTSQARISNGNATLSGTNKLDLEWSPVPGAAKYKLFRANPDNEAGQGVLIDDNITTTTYSLTTNPGTSYANWSTLTPSYNQGSLLKIRAAQVFVNEKTLTANATSPNVTGVNDVVTANSSTTVYTTFLGGTTGQILRVRVNDNNTSFSYNSGSFVFGTGQTSHLIGVSGGIYTWRLIGPTWYLISAPLQGINGNKLVTQWDTSLGIGGSSGTPSDTLHLYDTGNPGIRLDIGGGFYYRIRRQASGYLGFSGTQSGFTGYTFSTPNAADAVIIKDNGMIALRGETSSFPAIKRNSTALNFRLADDSADAPITAATGTFTGTVKSTTDGNTAPLQLVNSTYNSNGFELYADYSSAHGFSIYDKQNGLNRFAINNAGRAFALYGLTASKTLAVNNTSSTATLGGTTTLDFSAGNIFTVTMPAGNTTITASNVPVGFVFIHIIQDATGSRTVTWNSLFKFAAGTAPTLSTAASARDVLAFLCDATNCYQQSFTADVR